MKKGTYARARRDHKDTLFRMIFSTRESLRSLYNAVNHSNYADPAELERVAVHLREGKTLTESRKLAAEELNWVRKNKKFISESVEMKMSTLEMKDSKIGM